jgi:hypothetical protein
MNELVERLTNGLHPIVAERSASPRELREQIDRGFVLLKFPNTRGGTELGSQLDMTQTRLDGADFESGTGNVRLVGNLTLNYDKVQLVADIDLASLKGTGQLVLIEEAGGSKQVRTGGSATNGSGEKIDAMVEGESQKASKATGAKKQAGPKKKKTA